MNSSFQPQPGMVYSLDGKYVEYVNGVPVEVERTVGPQGQEIWSRVAQQNTASKPKSELNELKNNTNKLFGMFSSAVSREAKNLKKSVDISFQQNNTAVAERPAADLPPVQENPRREAAKGFAKQIMADTKTEVKGTVSYLRNGGVKKELNLFAKHVNGIIEQVPGMKPKDESNQVGQSQAIGQTSLPVAVAVPVHVAPVPRDADVDQLNAAEKIAGADSNIRN